MDSKSFMLALEKANENGYEMEYALYDTSRSSMPSEIYEERLEALLDPLFWQALGKAEGWEGKRGCEYTPAGTEVSVYYGGGWQDKWHRFIDHLAEGKPIDDFFNNLLK